ncbi:MAG: hypothetical protein EOP06_26355 [Proteobacteria bacterium]|nr:MAG: hypothetical protein EOP06_26355 [Pseudomonadota bacterium]
MALLGSAQVWNSGALRVQNKASNSAEEVSKQFIAQLTGYGVAEKRYHTDTYFFIGKQRLISNKSVSDPYAEFLFESLSLQIYLPQFRARLSTSNGNSARVRVEPDKAAPPREVVLIREKGAWKVDLMATYANWNQLTEAQARQQVIRRGALSLPQGPLSPPPKND